jgi:hypothetical protein
MSRMRWSALAAYAVGLFVLWCSRGVYDDQEALKYVGCAQQLLNGDVHDLFGTYACYGSYVLFLVPFTAVGLPALAVVVQALLGVLAAFALVRMALRMGASDRAADMAFALFLLCYPLQQWVLALYTEAFFVCVLILFVECVSRNARLDPWTWVLALILMFTRPAGALLVLSALVWHWSRHRALPELRVYLPLFYAGVLLALIAYPGVLHHQLAVIVEGHVICGFPERPNSAVGFHGNSVLAAQAYLFSHNSPGYALGLFVRRVASLYTLGRTYYSTGHNVLISGYYLYFAAALVGLRRSGKHAITGLLVALIVLYSGLIGFTYDEWNGRFLAPLWPWISILAGVGLASLIPERGPR